MTVLNASCKFITCLWDRTNTNKKSLVVPETEDDQKLQSELHIMLSSLEEVKTNNKEADDSLHEALYGLIEKIQQVSLRTLDNQTVDPSTSLQRQLDVASLGGLIDRMNKRRLVDQVIVSLFKKKKLNSNALLFVHLSCRSGYLIQNN